MVLAGIGTAGVISAYFFWHMTSGYSLNVSDPIEGQPIQLSYYLCAFGCGLVFWLLVLLWAKLRDSGDRQADIREVAKLAILIAPITTLNLCGCLLAPFMKLPLLVRFLVLFQVSSNLALLLIWAFLSLKECMILLDAHTQQQQKSSHRDLRCPPPRGRVLKEIFWPRMLSSGERVIPPKGSWKSHPKSGFEGAKEGSVPRFGVKREAVHNDDDVGGKVDEAGESGSGHGSGAEGAKEGSVPRFGVKREAVHNDDGVGGKVDEAGEKI